MAVNHIDTHDGLYWLVAAAAAMVAALVVFGVTGRPGETETNLPPPTYYQHPEGP